MSMLPLGKLAPVAVSQLEAWEAIADGWTTYEQGNCVRCASCHIAIWRMADRNLTPYRYTDQERLTLTVAHLRQAHMDLDPDR